MQLHDVYNRAMSLAQQKDARAKYWFAALLRYCPSEARAWLALIELADTAEERRYCFDMVLELDPAVMPAGKRFNMSSGIARRPACLDLTDQQLHELMVNAQHKALAPTTRLPGIALDHYLQAVEAAQPTRYEVHPDLIEAETIARKLLADPAKLGRWLGYGARLADEL